MRKVLRVARRKVDRVRTGQARHLWYVPARFQLLNLWCKNASLTSKNVEDTSRVPRSTAKSSARRSCGVDLLGMKSGERIEGRRLNPSAE